MSDNFIQGDKFLVRQKILKLLGGAFHVYDGDGNVVLYAKQKAFKLKEDLRFFASEEQKQEILRISARGIIDFGTTYDVYDSQTDELIGSLKRSGLKSMLKDQWVILDKAEAEIGKIHEDSALMAMLRRFVTSLIPQTYHVYNKQGEAIAEFKRNFNPFVNKVHVDFEYGTDEKMDKRLGLAGVLLLVAIEGKQG
jgi:uncharacterized protein YxjI